MSQDTFNKIITLGLFLFFMAVFIASFITGKSVDWQTLTVFIIPTVAHIVNQFNTTTVTTANIQAHSSQAVASIQATNPNTTNGVSTHD